MGKSLSDRAYESIKEDILVCHFPPGHQVGQAQLVDRYHIGVTPIREALQRLAVEGYVQAIPRFNYVVTQITTKDVTEIYETRAIIEAAAARLAARRGTDQQLENLLNIADFAYTHKDLETYKTYLSYNAEFHCTIAKIAGNQRMVEIISHLLEELTRLFYLGLDIRDGAQKMRAEHILLANAIHSRDEDKAAELAYTQIEQSRKRVMEALDSYWKTNNYPTIFR
jgi:DNA-binding GntR family transcriptional regulator